MFKFTQRNNNKERSVGIDGEDDSEVAGIEHFEADRKVVKLHQNKVKHASDGTFFYHDELGIILSARYYYLCIRIASDSLMLLACRFAGDN